MDLILQSSVIVVWRSRDFLLVLYHFVAQSYSLSLWDEMGELGAAVECHFFPVVLRGVFTRVDTALGSFHHLVDIPI